MTESLNRILVPVDFGAHSEKAIRFATTLANKFGARVSLLHVVEDPFVTGAWQAEVFVPNIPELLTDLLNAAKTQLAERKTHLAAHGFIVQTATISHPFATSETRDAPRVSHAIATVAEPEKYAGATSRRTISGSGPAVSGRNAWAPSRM